MNNSETRVHYLILTKHFKYFVNVPSCLSSLLATHSKQGIYPTITRLFARPTENVLEIFNFWKAGRKIPDLLLSVLEIH